MQAGLRAQLFDLAEEDREAIRYIRGRLELNSNALAVRLAIRQLRRQLETDHPRAVAEPAEEGEKNA